MARTIAKLVGALAVVAIAHPTDAAPAAPEPRPNAVEHRAAVVVHTGSQVFTGCVRFSEDSISGKEALERADMRPVFRMYSGQGTAVCALCGKGCPADDSCLTCGGDNYWAYHRARAASAAYTPSQAGVSSTRVRDGDVEGWPQPSSAPQPAPPGPPGTEPPPLPSTAAPSARFAPTTVAAPVTTTAETTTTMSVTPPTDVAPTDPAPAEVAGRSARRAKPADSEAGAPLSLLMFVVLITTIVGWSIWARRRRPRSVA
jgi:hypothetical protein